VSQRKYGKNSLSGADDLETEFGFVSRSWIYMFESQNKKAGSSLNFTFMELYTFALCLDP